MAFPTTVPTVTDGDTFTTTLWNTYAEQANGLLTPPVCVVQQGPGTSQQVSGLVGEPVTTWSAAETDPYGMWASGSPTRITVPSTGLYYVCGYVQMQTDPGSTYRALQVVRNGSITDQVADRQNGNGSASVSAVVSMTAGQYLELWVIADTTTALVGGRFGVAWTGRTT